MVPCGIICAYGLVTLLAASLVQCVQIQDHMTDDEIANLFHTSPDKMLEYDVVSIRHNLYKRSSSNLRLEFNAFGKKIDVDLHSSDGVLAGQNTPVWLASTNTNGTVEYKKMPGDIMGTVVSTFVSRSGLSTIAAFKPEGQKVSFKGFINGLKVIPFSRNSTKLARSVRELESSKSGRTLVETHHHVIIKSTSSTNEHDMLTHLDRKIHESRVLNETNYSKSKRSTKDIIYPSILVCTDFAPSNAIQDDFAYYDEIIYQLAFWNAVNLRFRHVDNPKIRLRIVGIIIGLDRGATPYVNKYRNGDVITLAGIPLSWDDYWFTMSERPDFPIESYNVVVTITELGLKHDGMTGDECDASYHYIMSPTTSFGPKSLEWSPCSLRSLSYLLRNEAINCVDQPAEFHPPGSAVQRLLPGDVVTTDEQCQGRGYDWACATNPETCTNMECYYSFWRRFTKGWGCIYTGPAAEGTTCSPGHKCFDGVCRSVSNECASKS